MTIHSILKMGDARLLRVARPVQVFDTPELRQLVQDMYDTMHHASGAGLSAPQIGVDLQVVVLVRTSPIPGIPSGPWFRRLF
jgi:peptide deformylase